MIYLCVQLLTKIIKICYQQGTGMKIAPIIFIFGWNVRGIVFNSVFFRLGLDDNACTWLKSFLSNRTQVTSYRNALSDPTPNTIGVPQGSILESLLFIIFVNYLPSVLEHCDVTLYADDTVLTYSSTSAQDVDSKMNTDLDRVATWLNNNRLTLNAKKSKFMLIGN